MPKTCLITRPNHESTVNFLYAYSQVIIDLAVKKSFSLVDLSSKLANLRNFQLQIKNKFSLIILNGHGSSHIITGWKNQPLVTAPVSEFDFQGAIVYARSCQAGLAAGPYIVKRHASAFIGYQADFIFVSSGDSDPLQDTLAKLFLFPSNAIIVSLINGRTVAKASQRAKIMMRKNIRLVLKSQVRNRQQIAAFLWHDINCQTILDNDQSKISSI